MASAVILVPWANTSSRVISTPTTVMVDPARHSTSISAINSTPSLAWVLGCPEPGFHDGRILAGRNDEPRRSGARVRFLD